MRLACAPALLLLLLSQRSLSSPTTYFAGDSAAFSYEGRWDTSSSNYRTDWPCARVSFGVSPPPEGGEVAIEWAAMRTRVNATAWKEDGTIASTSIFTSSTMGRRLKKQTDTLSIPADAVMVTFRKLTQGAPFGGGIGESLLTSSQMTLNSVSSDSVRVTPPPTRKLTIEYIGASDTGAFSQNPNAGQALTHSIHSLRSPSSLRSLAAGYCVDGTPDIDDTAELYLSGWKYDNCDLATPGLLAHSLDANLHVEAEGGFGLTQNANAKHRSFEGPHPLPYFWDNQTLLTDPNPPWDSSLSSTPDLVLISLGGNDFNHQKGRVPSDEDFSAVYADFLLSIFSEYGSDVKIMGVCGQGSPAEAEFDPDNNRCSPCPHVEAATAAFKGAHPELAARVGYVNVPCDGSVVVGDEDIGCAGHKNQLGQHEVFSYISPAVESFLSS